MTAEEKSQLIDKIIAYLGNPKNAYEIKYMAGEWFVIHSVVNSGEPLKQIIENL